jgi:hypothetical protein
MVESTPFDKDWDEQDPYDMALNSDEDREQLRTVSQEDDLADSNESAPHRSVISISTGSKKPPATSGADPTVVGSANQSPATSGASKPPATSGASKPPATSGASQSSATSGATRSATSGSNAPRGPARLEHFGSNAPQVDLTRTTPAASAASSTPNPRDTATSAVYDRHGTL